MSWTLRRDGDGDGDAIIVGMNTSPMNLQNERFVQDLHDALDALERDHAGAPVVLASEGRCFSAGLDFEAVFGLFASGDRDAITAWVTRYTGAIARVFTLARPTVAAIAGPAFAGGMVLALACDFRVLADDARVCLNEVPIGIPMPPVYVELIRHATGDRVARRAMLLGEELAAADALAAGLVDAVAPEAGVIAAARALLSRHTPDATAAYAFTKRALQAPVLDHIRAGADALDRELLSVLASPATRRLLARRYQQIKGAPPPWGDPGPG